MTYPATIEQKLGFDEIRQLAAQKCLSSLGRHYIEKIRFGNRFDVIEKMLLQVREFKNLLQHDKPFPSENFHDVFPFLNKAKIEGVYLLEEEFYSLKLTVSAFLQITRYFRERPTQYVNLETILEGLVYSDLVIRRIDRVLDPEGLLRPNASPELAKLSTKINEKEKEVRRRINVLYEKAAKNDYLATDLEITIRDGRLVLPVLAEHKRHIAGFVHDESNTGQTVYIEPADCFELNNLIRELQLAYRRERERILLELTDQLKPDIPNLEKNIQRMGLFDFIRAKALLAIELKAEMPALVRHPGLKWFNAFHPLLKLKHEREKLPVVPLSVSLGSDNRILVISGPNAGGKSVCLKTVGLLQYMLQCGFLVPLSADSEAGIFKQLFADIGDEQSIDNDLSTYSSHLLHMKHFTDFADGKTLFLIDEFGMGTDPQFGGPLAEAILKHLNQKFSYGVITTHFSNLKNFAANTLGLQNACMLFDHERMQPLYILEAGKPGSSYAFEIAARTGLAQSIINYAKDRVGAKQKRVDDLLLEVEKEHRHMLELKQRFAEKESKAAALMEQYNRMKEDIEANKRKLIKEARQEALAIVSEANSRIEATIREIKEQQADAEVQRKARSYVKEEIKELKKETEHESEPIVSKTPDRIIQPGSFVKMEGQESIGEVLELNKNKAIVAFGLLRSTVDVRKLIAVEKSTQNPINTLSGMDVNAKLRDFKTELNLIGTRGEDALRMLTQYVDDAYLLGFKQVRVVHGKGYGILRKLMREALQANPLVENVANEQVELGGDGVSIVTLKL